MSKAYLVGQITITNAQAYAVYAAQAPQTVAAFGGMYLVRGGHATQVEGQSQGDRNVVIEFPSREAAEAWYASDGYQSIIKHRTDNASGSLALVDGYES
jgi:uncharacterized protein (DUF1330 family)